MVRHLEEGFTQSAGLDYQDSMSPEVVLSSDVLPMCDHVPNFRDRLDHQENLLRIRKLLKETKL